MTDLSTYTTAEVVAETGLTARQLDYWRTTDLLTPSVRDAKGFGSTCLYSATDLERAREIKRRLDAGYALPAIRKHLTETTPTPPPAAAPIGDTMPELDPTITEAFRILTDAVTSTNRANGWFEKDRTVGDDAALLHSEVSEMFEAYRDHGLADVTDMLAAVRAGTEDPRLRGLPPKPEGFGSECADILIRLLDTCYRHGIDLPTEVHRKIAYNRTRPHRHGGKLL